MKCGRFPVTIFILAMLIIQSCLAAGLVGQFAPEITISRWITTNDQDIDDLVGKVYLLDFWATWCSPCVDNIPHLKKLNEEYKDKGLVLIALSQDNSPQLVRQFVDNHKMTYPVAIDNGTADWFGIKSYPTLVLVDSRGKIAWRGHPWNRGLEKKIQEAIAQRPESLLAGIDLSPFGYPKNSLATDSDFIVIYDRIKSFLGSKDKRKAAAAEKVVALIDNRLRDRLSEANKKRKKDPAEAYRMYREIVARFDGIGIVAPAKRAYLELKKLKDAKLSAKKSP